MATNVRHRSSRQRQVLDELIQEHGFTVGSYALFFVTGEGKYLPSSTPWADIEETSGHVLDRSGRVFAFWLGWDARREGPGLVDWQEVPAEPGWSKAPEYQRARQAVGLASVPRID